MAEGEHLSNSCAGKEREVDEVYRNSPNKEDTGSGALPEGGEVSVEEAQPRQVMAHVEANVRWTDKVLPPHTARPTKTLGNAKEKEGGVDVRRKGEGCRRGEELLKLITDGPREEPRAAADEGGESTGLSAKGTLPPPTQRKAARWRL